MTPDGIDVQGAPETFSVMLLCPGIRSAVIVRTEAVLNARRPDRRRQAVPGQPFSGTGPLRRNQAGNSS
ncbi:hypothetical protein [Pseudarthrobacter sp. PvP090]|uniref:hypothetical protein n=1 Tax=Pseudarthrobacter sp. PvP090 TaxID=3156393 RepID=UPI00339628B9